MRIRFWGVRGSYPVAGRSTVRYGGNTSCIEVELDDRTLLILDAGSGLRPLGDHLVKGEFGKGNGKATFLITHTHWDHIMGMPFFAPASVAGNEFTVYALKRDGMPLESIFVEQQSTEYYDHPFTEFPARFTFREISAGDILAAGSATITSGRLNHPYYALAYRIVADGAVLGYVTDTSPFREVLIEDWFIKNPADAAPSPEGPRHDALVRLREGLVKLMAEADLVIYDTFFEPEGYRSRPHWGHSTPDDAISDCQKARAKRLALFHHAPDNSDEQMDRLQEKYREKAKGGGLNVFAAYEGLELRLP
jgi:phosphoribosyl 1,2-cyclic phosphodiesterase